MSIIDAWNLSENVFHTTGFLLKMWTWISLYVPFFIGSVTCRFFYFTNKQRLYVRIQEISHVSLWVCVPHIKKCHLNLENKNVNSHVYWLIVMCGVEIVADGIVWSTRSTYLFSGRKMTTVFSLDLAISSCPCAGLRGYIWSNPEICTTGKYLKFNVTTMCFGDYRRFLR